MSASSGSGGMSASSGSTSSGSGGMGAGQTVEVGPMLNLSIPNNSYDGTKSTMVCADLVAPSEAVNVVAEVTLEIGIDHDWVGDLTIKLDSPSGTTVTLMSMPGEIRSADDGSGFSFESSDLVASAPILFLAGAAVSAEDMGLSLANSEVICQDDAICEYAPDHGAATASALSDFIGEASNGTWEICVADSVGGNSGTLDAAKLTIVK